MGIKVITAPDAVLAPAELYQHLKLDSVAAAADAALVASHLLAAHEYAEHHSGSSIGTQTLELALDAFPAGPIRLPQGPVASITSIKYTDATSGVLTTLDASLYALDDYSTPAWALQAYGTSWPDTLAVANAVKVRYVAGGALKAAVRAALLLIVGHLYANREAVAPGTLVEVPLGVNVLLDTVKDWSR